MPDRDTQLSLFDVEAVYSAARDPLSNRQLYDALVAKLGLPASVLTETAPVGESGKPANLWTRSVRWHQQTLKRAGVLEQVPDQVGVWRLSRQAKTELHESMGKVALLAFSTDLGAAIWGLAEPTFKDLDCPITLCFTSPPYLLRKSRAYGNLKSEAAYIDWLCTSLEPIVGNLKPSGTIALNISNDIFEPGIPARTLYRERLMLALHERLGLYKADEVVWHNPSKPPGPTQWAGVTRQMLCTGYEPIYLLSPNPEAWCADNRRVLQPYTERYLKYLERADEEEKRFSDGAHVRNSRSYRRNNGGSIPTNVLTMSHSCASQREYKAAARAAGLPAHGAPFPLKLAEFCVEYLTQAMDLVVDPFAGSMTTGLAAESLGRRWLCVDAMAEYAVGAASRFGSAAGFSLNEEASQWLG